MPTSPRSATGGFSERFHAGRQITIFPASASEEREADFPRLPTTANMLACATTSIIFDNTGRSFRKGFLIISLPGRFRAMRIAHYFDTFRATEALEAPMMA